MRKLSLLLMCTLLLTGCNIAAGSDTAEPAYNVEDSTHTYPTEGVFDDDNSARIVFRYMDSLVVERSYNYVGDVFDNLTINVYPLAHYEDADLTSIADGVKFEWCDWYYSATLTEGAEVATPMSMGKKELYDSLLAQYTYLTSR